MSDVFRKLNLKDQKRIVVLNAPASFDAELKTLKGVRVAPTLGHAKESFILAFAITQAHVDTVAKQLAAKAEGDAVVWFAYPKGSSKRYTCEFNRDTGWKAVGRAGFEGVRQVAIDEDWSALRFRRVEYIRTMIRDPKRAMTAKGRTRVAKKK